MSYNKFITVIFYIEFNNIEKISEFQKLEEKMKFDLSDFLELDTKALLAVNGGSDCSTSYSGPSSDDSGSSGNGPGSSTTTSGSKSGGGYCSGGSDGKTVYKNPYYKNPGDKGTTTVSGGGTCTSFDLTPWKEHVEGGNDSDSAISYTNQRDFSSIYGDSFGDNACAATSLLNEISEQYTKETGKPLTPEQINSAMDAAVNSGNINSSNAFINNWEGAANDMAAALGLSGSYVLTTDPSLANSTIYAIDRNNDGVVDHFVNDIGNGQYYDPWTGKIGNISDEALATSGLGGTRNFSYSVN